ncbi:hypothetical protein LS74_010185 [Helicobacter magdeburgensis]|uniref:Uncharacterized protein n=1 Tax=Helicobacter magdeburgensis TaxID=471858 RepID=A0A4U8SWM1_9HELI|nr:MULTISPECIES: hypothetical protein [Helicobacter]TLD91148.1 hypothetical protein LS74_010185 [Helicobacter magdeburgensis]BDB65770.1 hypothetical protein T36_2249 [Helicobacter cinaedi]
MKNFKTINYGAYNILVAIVNDEIYFKTEDIKKTLNLDTYKEQMSNKTKFCGIDFALDLAKSSSVYYKDGFALWLEYEYKSMKHDIL